MWRVFFAVAAGVAVPGLMLAGGTLVLGNHILQNSLTDMRIGNTKAHESLVREISDKTDAGQLSNSVARLSEKLGQLGDLPNKLEALSKSVDELRSDLRVYNAKMEGFGKSLDAFGKSLDENKADTKSILQKISDRGPSPTNNEQDSFWLVAAAPDKDKAMWSLALSKVYSFGVRPKLAPIYFEGGKFGARLFDESSLPLMIKAGFTQLAAPGPQPPGLYVTLAQ